MHRSVACLLLAALVLAVCPVAALAPLGDHDFYRFTLEAPRDVVIDCRFRTADGDLDMALYDAAMTLVDASESIDDDEQIVRTGAEQLPAGDYFVEVYGFMDVRTNWDYRLVINAP